MFRFIRHEQDRGWTGFDGYFAYLASVRDRLGEDLYAFASDRDRYGLASRKSLHDAWLLRLTLSPADVREHPLRTNLELELLGPYHDRIFRIRHEDVATYSVNQLPRDLNAVQDLLCHELRLDERGEKIEHYLEFDDGFTVLVACRTLHFEETMLALDEPA